MGIRCKILALSLAILLFNATFAAALGITVSDNIGKSDTPGRSIVLSGKAKPVSSIRIEVLKPNVQYSALDNINDTNVRSILEYIYEGTTAADGRFESEPIIMHSGSGNYNFRIFGSDIETENGKEDTYSGSITYYTPIDLKARMADLGTKSANNVPAGELYNLLNDSKSILLIDTPIFKLYGSEITADAVKNLFSINRPYEFKDINLFRKNLVRELATIVINKNDVSLILNLLNKENELYSAPQLELTGIWADEQAKHRFERYQAFNNEVKRENIAKKITQKAKGTDGNEINYTFNKFKEKFSDLVFISTMNDSANVTNTKLTWESMGTEIEYNSDIILSYNAYNALSDSKKASVQRELYGKKGNWTDMNSFDDDLRAAIANTGTVPAPKSSRDSGGSGPAMSGTLPIKTPEPINDEKGDGSFIDLGDVDWARAAIDYLSISGVVNGDGERFHPNNNVKREEFVKMVVLAFNKLDNTAKASFDDVSDGDWFYPYIATAKNIGVVNGISSTEFGVGQELSRQDLITMVYKFALAVGYEFNKDAVYIPFSDDAYVSDYAKEAVQTMTSVGFIKGSGDNLLNPTSPCTRAEAAKIIFEVILQVNK